MSAAEQQESFLTPGRMKALFWSVCAAVLLYLGAAVWSGWHDMVEAVLRVGAPGILVALAMSLVNYGLRFVRWQRYLSVMGHPVAWQPSLRIYVAGWSLTTLPGKMGETVRSLFLKPHGVPYPVSLAAFISERLSDLMSMLLLASLGLLTYPAARPFALGLWALVFVALLVLQQQSLLVRLREKLARYSGWLAQAVCHGLDIVLHSGRCFSLPMLLQGLAIGLVAWSAEGLAFWYLAHLAGVDLSHLTGQFIYGFSVLVGAASFLPGGLGGTEVAMTGLLINAGLSESASVAVTVLCRLATLWFSVLLGLYALSGLKGRPG